MAAARFIGLTGAIASGKSEALAALARLGAAALSSDAVVHDLLTSERVRDLLVGRWGPTVAPNGEVDRGRVSEVVFADPSELDWLEATLHPLVAEEIADWRESLPDGTTVAVVDVPLLFETGGEKRVDASPWWMRLLAPSPWTEPPCPIGVGNPSAQGSPVRSFRIPPQTSTTGTPW